MKYYFIFAGGGTLGKSPSLESLFETRVAGQVARLAFTLAEVLITLGIVGVVSALTMPAIITNIQNKGYVEGLKKNYSVLQQVTNTIIQEEGAPDTWAYTIHQSDDNSASEYIVANYVKHLQARCYRLSSVGYSIDASFCDGTKFLRTIHYKSLDGTDGSGIYGWPLFVSSYPIMLQDGTLIGIHFGVQKGATFYGTPSMSFVIDVNGWKKPNKVGRDVFFLYLMNDKSGKILPYVSDSEASRLGLRRGDTCGKNKSGHSCAYRVITEGKMNY